MSFFKDFKDDLSQAVNELMPDEGAKAAPEPQMVDTITEPSTPIGQDDLAELIKGLDEPEAALSPVSQMSLLIRINQLANLNSQFIIATHSPILLAIPNAEILEITEKDIRQKKYFETEHFKTMKNFFENTEKTVDSLIRN